MSFEEMQKYKKDLEAAKRDIVLDRAVSIQFGDRRVTRPSLAMLNEELDRVNAELGISAAADNDADFLLGASARMTPWP